MVKFTVFFISLLMTSHAFAHVGHDHSSAMSGLIHLLWLAPLVVAAVLLVPHVKKRFFTPRNK